MEAYKTVCPVCGYIRFWVGYKTGIGKTPEQLAQMEKDHTTCKRCGFTKAKTELDSETEIGEVFAEQTKCIVDLIGEVLGEKK